MRNISSEISTLRRRILAGGMAGLIFATCGVSHAADTTAPATAPEDFWIAIANDRVQDVKRFLSRGVSPNAVNPLSNTALMEAIKTDSWKVYDVLLADARLDVNGRNLLGENALMYLAIKSDVKRAAHLITQREAQVNQPGWTPLHYAATVGADDVVRLLIEHHAYIDAESPDKTTPLMMAMRYGKPVTANLLLDEGAYGYARNAQGKNAADLAREAGYDSIADDFVERLNAEKRRKAGR